MQDPQQRGLQGGAGPPAQAAGNLQRAGQYRQRHHQPSRCGQCPCQQGGDGERDRRFLERLVAVDLQATEAVAGEVWNDASADHRLQGRHQGKADQDGLQGVAAKDARRAQVEEQVGGEQRGEQHQHEIVALVAGPEQHAAERDGNRRKKGEIDGCGEACRSDRKGDPPAQPEPCQHCKWRAGRGVEAGPCAARGEQETGDDRTGKAEEHLVGMPRHGGKGGWRRQESREHRQPGWNHDRGEARGKQVEGPKTKRQQRAAARAVGRCLLRFGKRNDTHACTCRSCIAQA